MRATLNGVSHWFEVHGGEGTPVLLIMGFGMSGRAWAPQIRGLAPRHQVAIYDNRGIGQTDPSPRPYGFSELAEDGLALMDHLGWADAHVVGVSMGGMIAQHLALGARARVRSLTLIATHPGGSLRHTTPPLRGLRLFLKANTSRGEERLEALRHLLYTPTFLARQAEGGAPAAASGNGHAHGSTNAALAAEFSEEALELFAVPAARSTLSSQLRAILRHDTTPQLGSLEQVPTLVVRPGADLLVPPRNADRLHKLIPRSRLLSLADAGHGVTHERAEEVNRHLLAHLDLADKARVAAVHA